MAQEHLGNVIDIHGGGTDLVFPHHEAEAEGNGWAARTAAATLGF